MKIIDLERKTGLDRATIRYYEKEGLIHPKRLENGYRDYTDEEQSHLLKIKLLRQLGMPLDRIRNLQQGSEDFSEVLSDQMRQLEWKIVFAQRAKVICQEMLDDHVSYETLNAEVYFQKLLDQSKPNVLDIPKAYHDPTAKEPYHPVRRFVARMLDYHIIGALLLFIVVVILRVRPISDFLSTVISYSSLILAALVMPAMLHSYGTTPGKWLMGLGVEDCNGGCLSYSDAFGRECYALWRGYGFGIPIYSIIRLVKSLQSCGKEPLEWESGSEYIYYPWKAKRKIALLLAIILLFSVTLLNFHDLLKPSHRGDLTISEFASNYNDYMVDYFESPSKNQYMLDDGTWAKETGHVIVVGSKSEDRNFTYEREGENITRISYQNTWTDVFACSPLKGKAQIAAVTLLMSQRNASIRDLYELEELWSTIGSRPSGSFVCKNIEIRWEIQAINCKPSNDNRYFQDNEELESSVTLDFELIVH